jgi:hypothetical protein
MPEDFGYVWRTVRLYCPSAPTFLAREWANVAWKQLLAARRWGFMRGELLLNITESDETVTMPADFASFEVLVDESRQVRIAFDQSLDALGCRDPALTATGPVLALIATTLSPQGYARYLVYPHGSASTLTGIYHRQGARLDDTSVLTGVLADGAEVLVAGALAQAALWPGTGEKPNPYFNAGLAQTKKAEFDYGVQMLSLRDDDQTPDDLWDSWPVCDCCYAGDPRTTDALA